MSLMKNLILLLGAVLLVGCGHFDDWINRPSSSISESFLKAVGVLAIIISPMAIFFILYWFKRKSETQGKYIRFVRFVEGIGSALLGAIYWILTGLILFAMILIVRSCH